MIENVTGAMLGNAAGVGAVVYAAVLIFKNATKMTGWLMTILALGLCILAAWGFWEWGTRQAVVLNTFNIILAFGGATLVNRTVNKLAGK